MDYKEKVIALLSNQELSKEQKEKLEDIFPELKESKEERIRKMLRAYIHDFGVPKEYFVDVETSDVIAWLEQQGEIDLEHYKDDENEKRKFVGYGFLKCKGDFLSFKEGETYWLEYVGKDNYNVRSDNLLGQTFHIKPVELYTVFRPTTWLEKQGKQCEAESNDEDEKIKKEIIAIFKGKIPYTSEEDAKRYIDWLEKQKEFVSADFDDVWETADCDELTAPLEKYSKDAIKEMCHAWYDKGIELERRNWLEKQGENEYVFRPIAGTMIENAVEQALEQGEQTPNDNIEPKFKVGDWVVRGKSIVQISDIQGRYYIGTDIYGNDLTSRSDKIHLWTIADANDGDVLYLQHGGVEHVIIYKRLVKKNFHSILSVHCAYDGSTNDFFEDVDSYHCITSERDEKEIHPATKEQRDLLFQKMKEAGYVWDAKKKELSHKYSF